MKAISKSLRLLLVLVLLLMSFGQISNAYADEVNKTSSTEMFNSSKKNSNHGQTDNNMSKAMSSDSNSNNKKSSSESSRQGSTSKQQTNDLEKNSKAIDDNTSEKKDKSENSSVLPASNRPIPGPPEAGPKVAGKFFINGYKPIQNDEYSNMQIVSDGTAYKSESMWYKNPVNINRPFQTKFYIYMDGDADGLTFTLQGQGNTALGTSGEALGSYGTFRQRTYGGFLRNALSLEFDPYYNGDFSDTKLPKGQHVSYTHPDEAEPISPWTPSGFSLKHYNPLLVSNYALSNSKWHQAVVKWTPSGSTGTMEASFDGKSLGPHTVPLSRFGRGDVYWGFTGSTGQESMKGAVAYTQVIQQPTFTKLVRNVSRGETNFSDNTSAEVGDKLEYKFITQNDKQNGLGNTWDNVKIKDTLPNGIETMDGKNQVNFSIGDVTVGGTVERTFSARVTKNDDIDLVNSAEADGSNYYISPVTLESNDATVHVKKQLKPAKININNYLYNRTFPDDHNSDNTEISKVQKNDNIQFTALVSNTVDGSVINDGIYNFDLPSETIVNSVKLNGKELMNGSQYTTTEIEGKLKLSILNMNLVGNEEKKIEVDTLINTIANTQSFNTTPVFSGKNADGSINRSSGKTLRINFGDDSLSINPKNISYGSHPFVNSNQIISRTDDTNAPNSVLNVIDNRRIRNGTKIYVSQLDKFRNVDDYQSTIPSQLRYYQKNQYDLVTDLPMLINQTKDGQKVADISWNSKEGLLLNSNGTNFTPGRYQTTLNWTCVNGY